ncbi:MAG: hypothetical protein ABII22_04845 [Candidatus Micrarchaeota archaeon]
MYDIVRFESDQNYNYEKVKDKILRCKNVEQARQQWNRKALVMLEDYSFDEGLMKEIAEKKKLCFLLDLSRIIKSYGVRRAIELTKMRNFLRFCNKFGAFYAFATFEEKKENARSEREVLNIAKLFEINDGQAKFAVKMLQHYL